jgi:hypothetical protein
MLLFLLSDFELRYLLAVESDPGKEVPYVEVGVAAVAKPWPVGSPHNCRETQCSSWSSPSSPACGLDLDYHMQSSPRA